MFLLPIGPDRADGKTKLPFNPVGSNGTGTLGTPNSDDQVQVEGPNGTKEVSVEESVDSPEIERAEQATFQHRLTMTYVDAINYLKGLARGTFVQDSGILFGEVTTWRILSSRIKALIGGRAELSYTAESISFDSPPDDFSITPTDLGLDLLKHPRYSWALNPVEGDQNTHKQVNGIQIFYTDIKSSIIRVIQSYRDAPFFPSVNAINGLIQTNIMSQIKSGKLDVHYNNPNYPAANTDAPGGPATAAPVRWDGSGTIPATNCPYFIVMVPVDLSNNSDPIVIAIAAAKEIISKLWRQEDAPYIPSYELVWTQYFFAPVYEDGGGYIQDPLTVVPVYFTDPNQDGSDNIFSQLSKINPQLFSSTGINGGPVNISWLRKADETRYERTWFAVTHRWIGSPIGTFDKDLYTTDDRPQNAGDFTQLV